MTTLPTRTDFVTAYREELRKVAETPGHVAWDPRNVETVADRMIAAFDTRSYNKDGRAIKATCKRLGIKYTYTAINEVLAR